MPACHDRRVLRRPTTRRVVEHPNRYGRWRAFIPGQFDEACLLPGSRRFRLRLQGTGPARWLADIGLDDFTTDPDKALTYATRAEAFAYIRNSDIHMEENFFDLVVIDEVSL